MGILGIGESDYKVTGPGYHQNPYQDLGRGSYIDAPNDKDLLEHDYAGLASGQSQQHSYAIAPQAAPAQLGYIAPAEKPRLDPGLAMAPGLGVVGAGLGVTAGGLSDAAGTRELQRYNLGLLHQAASGAVPSAAEAQLQRGLDAGLMQNLALAASASGTAANQTAARTGAQRANTSAVLQTGGQAAQLRAQEQAIARQALTDSLSGIRNQDLGTAGLGVQVAGVGGTLAGIGMQGGIAQLGADKDVELGNLGARKDGVLAQLSSETQTHLADLNAKLEARGMDERSRLEYLGKMIGIDTATAEGQLRLIQLFEELRLRAEGIAAGISTGNAAGETQQLGALISGGGTVAGAAVGGG